MNVNVLYSGWWVGFGAENLEFEPVCFGAFYYGVNNSPWQVSIFLWSKALHCIPNVGENLVMRPMTFESLFANVGMG